MFRCINIPTASYAENRKKWATVDAWTKLRDLQLVWAIYDLGSRDILIPTSTVDRWVFIYSRTFILLYIYTFYRFIHVTWVIPSPYKLYERYTIVLIMAGTSLSIHSTILIDEEIHFNMWKKWKEDGHNGYQVVHFAMVLYTHEMYQNLMTIIIF